MLSDIVAMVVTVSRHCLVFLLSHFAPFPFLFGLFLVGLVSCFAHSAGSRQSYLQSNGLKYVTGRKCNFIKYCYYFLVNLPKKVKKISDLDEVQRTRKIESKAPFGKV